jgi:hydroxymethylpyrimidine pyrophosphatase-like HAD family hydrolase
VTSYRLLALDIDGTLLGSDKGVSERTRAAIAAAHARGVRLVLLTGRRYPAARRVAETLGHDVPLVLHNGALIVEAGSVLRCRPLGRAAAASAVRLGRAQGAEPVIHAGQRGEGRLLIERVSPGNKLLVDYLDRSGADVVRVADLLTELLLGEDPMQVMFAGAAAAMDALVAPLGDALGGEARLERTTYPRQGVGIIDVLHPGVGKAGALAFLQQRWGLAPRETLAIGDNWNDREMLERAGLGLVMGNADPALRALGLPVLPSNDEDGVAVALETYVLGAP